MAKNNEFPGARQVPVAVILQLLLLLSVLLFFGAAGCQSGTAEGGGGFRAPAVAAPEQVQPVAPDTGRLSSRSGGNDLRPASSGDEHEASGSGAGNNDAGEGSDQDRTPAGDGSEASSFRVEVSIAEQRVLIYQHGDLIREMVASTGTPDKPTPTGHFRLQNRGEWFFSQKYQQGARWWVSFKDWGVYLFHSVPMDEERHIIAAEAAKLGRPASHGCVRLSVEDARWFYETVPAGTPVHIY